MSLPPKISFEDIGLSNFSPNIKDAPFSQTQNRQAFQRQSSAHAIEYQHIPTNNDDGRERAANILEQGIYGLGLKNVTSDSFSIRRAPVGATKSRIISNTTPLPSQSRSPDGLTTGFSHASTVNDSTVKSPGNVSVDWTAPEGDFGSPGETSHLHHASNIDLINHSKGSGFDCPTEGDLLMSPWSSLTISILLLSIYSTIFSAIFLAIALAQPRWGQRIGVSGNMSYSTATSLSALFSKTVELSFVTVFVALLGQVLSRRAFAKGSAHGERMSNAKIPTRSWKTHWKEVLSPWAFFKSSGHGGGISIAEMSMRSWIMQPGTLITHWRTVKYAAATVVGGLALVATLAAMFYTTAAEALVAPKLKFGPQQERVLLGTVATAFANAKYLSENCRTPISEEQDPEDGGRTCLQIEYAGQSYHDFETWLAEWSETLLVGNDTGTTTLEGRPKPVAMLHKNTTVTGQWISSGHGNITADSALHGRLVQNVTMAMPHANLFNAAVNPANGILQPHDLQGQGEYEISASIPAPALTVLCAGMTAEELIPLIHDENGPRNFSLPTAVDELFNFGDEASQDPAPQFPKLPIAHNTIHNVSEPWGTSAVYLLATPPSYISSKYHILCSVRAMQYPYCTTKYHAAQSGGQLSVHCDDDPGNTMPYIQSEPSATVGFVEANWKDVGSEWIRSTALGHGRSDANASIARLMTQMIPLDSSETAVLKPTLPSIAEALAVLAGCTLVMSSANAPFVHYYNYSNTIPPIPRPQYFNASLKYKDYASGASDAWQGTFYLILFLVFAINVFALIYLAQQVFWYGHVTDYTEPENLFTIANLSPPSPILQGACGGGPRGGMLGKKWRVDMKSADDMHSVAQGVTRHPHFYVKCVEDDNLGGNGASENEESSRRRRRRNRHESVGHWYMMGQAQSPAIEQYRRLTG